MHLHLHLHMFQVKLKKRVLNQIVSPASATYLYETSLKNEFIEYKENNRPIVGETAINVFYVPLNCYPVCRYCLIRLPFTSPPPHLSTPCNRSIDRSIDLI